MTTSRLPVRQTGSDQHYLFFSDLQPFFFPGLSLLTASGFIFTLIFLLSFLFPPSNFSGLSFSRAIPAIPVENNAKNFFLFIIKFLPVTSPAVIRTHFNFFKIRQPFVCISI